MTTLLTHALAFLAGVYVGATAVALCVAAGRRTPRPPAAHEATTGIYPPYRPPAA